MGELDVDLYVLAVLAPMAEALLCRKGARFAKLLLEFLEFVSAGPGRRWVQASAL
jgi:hypothetical protein